MRPIDVVALVLTLAAAIGCVNHLWVRLPRSIGMLLGSVVLSVLALFIDRAGGPPLEHWYHTSMDAADLPHVFLDGALALLLFAGSLHVDARALSSRKWRILFLATWSVVFSSLVFGGGLFLAFHLSGLRVPLVWCCIVGAILAPTDAVVVQSLLRRAPLPAALRAAITGESLFNDGTALVLYLTALGIAEGRTGLIGHGHFLIALVTAVGGGAAVGGAGGAAASVLMRRIHDEGLQLLITLALVIGCYRIAEAAHVSAPIGVVSAGLALKLLTPDFGAGGGAYSALTGFWKLLDELLDTMLFLLIGFQVMALDFGGLVLPALLSMPLAVLARLLSVAVPVGFGPGMIGDKLREASVLTWAGLRGGISVALALTLPDSLYRTQLLGVCYAVVLFTIVAQGLTITGVLGLLYPARAEAGSEPSPT